MHNPGKQLVLLVPQKSRTQPLLVPCCSRRSEGRLIPAVQLTLFGVLIPLASPNRFSQKLELFNGDEQTCSMLVWYKSGTKRGHQGRCPRLGAVVLQRRRRSAVSFEISGTSQVVEVLPPFVPDWMTFKTESTSHPCLRLYACA